MNWQLFDRVTNISMSNPNGMKKEYLDAFQQLQSVELTLQWTDTGKDDLQEMIGAERISHFEQEESTWRAVLN